MRKIAIAATLVVLVAGCSNVPTSLSARDGKPRFDGGFTMGSGNVTGTPPQTGSATTPHPDVVADSTARGGFTMGSGN
jgi:hypothetical protein